MILKRDNVEKVILDDSVAKVMISKGWKDVTTKDEHQEEEPAEVEEEKPHEDEPQEKPKRTKKKSEDAE